MQSQNLKKQKQNKRTQPYSDISQYNSMNMSYLLRLIIAIMIKNIHRTILMAHQETAAAFPSGPHLESLVTLPIMLILSLVGPDQCENRFQLLSSLRPFLWQNMQLLYCPEFYNMGFNRQDQSDKESQFPKPLMSPPATPCPVQITFCLNFSAQHSRVSPVFPIHASYACGNQS